MQFENYQAIWSFFLIPILIIISVLVFRKKDRILFSFLSKEYLKSNIPTLFVNYEKVKLFFMSIGLSLILFSLLMPYAGMKMFEIKSKGTDLYFLVDLSTSMLAADIKPSRIVRAKREIKDFLEVLAGDRIGLIGFAGESFVFVPLTNDYQAFSLFSDELNTDLIPVSGTDIKGALEKAIKSFQAQSEIVSKAIILITDGEDSIGLDDSMLEKLKSMNVIVYIIGIGTPEGAPIPSGRGGYKENDKGEVVLTKLNEETLKNLAITTGGKYVRSISGDLDLKEIYNNGIKKQIHQSEFASKERKQPNYIFQWPLFIGILFLMCEVLVTKKKWFLKK